MIYKSLLCCLFFSASVFLIISSIGAALLIYERMKENEKREKLQRVRTSRERAGAVRPGSVQAVEPFGLPEGERERFSGSGSAGETAARPDFQRERGNGSAVPDQSGRNCSASGSAARSENDNSYHFIFWMSAGAVFVCLMINGMIL